MSGERRRQERRASQLNKLLPVKMLIEGKKGAIMANIFLVDLSIGGMKFTLDHEISPETFLDITLPLRAFGPRFPERATFPCQIRWNRRLLGGTWVHGVQFGALDERLKSTIERVFSEFPTETGRKHYRLPWPHAASLLLDEKWLPIMIRDISIDGLGFRSKRPISAFTTVRVRLPLKHRELEAESRVEWCLETQPGLYEIGCSLPFLDEVEAGLIRRFIQESVE